jgi:hypothetical protein
MDKQKSAAALKKAMDAIAKGDFKDALSTAEMILMSECKLISNCSHKH